MAGQVGEPDGSPTEYAAYWFGLNMYRVLSPIMLIIGNVGNILSFLVLYRKARKPPPTYFYMCMLAVVDMMALWIPCLRGWLNYTWGVDLMLKMGCSWYYVIFFSSTNFSVYTIINMTIDRFIFVYFPYTARTICTMRRAIIGIIIMYAIQLGANLHYPFSMSREVKVLNSTNGSDPVIIDHCVINPGYEYWMSAIWPYIDLTIYSFFPFIVLSSFNCLIIIKTAKQVATMRKAKGEGTDQDKEKDARKQAQQQKTTIMLVAVSLFMLATTTPIVILHIVEVYWDISHPYQFALHLAIQALVQHLMYCNNSMNFMLYMLTGKRFREDLKVLLGIKSQVDSEVASVTGTAAEHSVVATVKA